MAVFGIPRVHEDDALRAVRAAVQMRDRLATLNDELESSWGVRLLIRIGVNTGEVVTGGTEVPTYATGDAVNVAARLQQEASPGEILLGRETYRFVRDVVLTEILEPLEVKGKETAVDAVRLISHVADERETARFSSPMVGRGRERRRLHDAFEQAVTDSSCQLFTILGAAGVGKSRLVQEVVRDLEGAALVARGRCLPYGEGITYWPVLEAIRDAARLEDAETVEQSLTRIASILETETDADLVSRRIGEVIGLSDNASGTEEIFWALRTFFEALARRQSLVLVFDDIHWGEPTFLDLVDHISDWTRDAPILLVCVARSELLDVRPHWGGGKLNATSILLEPLTDGESLQLVENLVGSLELEDHSRRTIIEAADGNPLFVEEMLAYLIEYGVNGAAVDVPPTIQALLAARLDRLDDGERTAIEAASVEGKIFHESSVTDLISRPREQVRHDLQSLVRKELIRPDRGVFSGDRAYRFRHLLIRDAAYESIPKEARAALHETHAAWLEERAGERTLEFEEILGYHLEQASHYRADLGPVDARASELARVAGRRLGAAGRRALARGDAPAAIKLLSRAAALLPSDDPLRIQLVPGVRSVQGLGEELEWAEEVLSEAIATGEESIVLHARVQQALLRLFTKTSADVDELVAIANESIRAFDALGDELGQARSWRLLQQARYLERQSAASAEAAEHGLVHARRTDDPVEEGEILAWLGAAFFMGATPAPEAERRVRAHLDHVRGSRLGEALLLGCLAPLVAMQGRLDEGLEIGEDAGAIVDELGYFSQQLAVIPFHRGITYLLAGDTSAAERVLRASLGPLEAIRDTSNYCAIMAVLGRALNEQGRFAEAEETTHLSEQTAHLNDVFAHITWRPVRAKALAQRGELLEAERLAWEAIDFASASDFLNAHGDALLDLAEVLQLAGREADAAPAIEKALTVFVQKGNIVATDRARLRLEHLGVAAAPRPA
jgi:tetratricopeptide (TPR) repeat protein